MILASRGESSLVCAHAPPLLQAPVKDVSLMRRSQASGGESSLVHTHAPPLLHQPPVKVVSLMRRSLKLLEGNLPLSTLMRLLSLSSWIPDPQHWIDKALYFNPKNVNKFWEIWSKMFMPDADFLHPGSPDPGIKKITGSRIRICNTGWKAASHPLPTEYSLPDQINKCSDTFWCIQTSPSPSSRSRTCESVSCRACVPLLSCWPPHPRPQRVPAPPPQLVASSLPPREATKLSHSVILFNFKCCGTGTVGTGTFCLSETGTVILLWNLSGTGTVIKMESQKWTQYKIVYLISFI